MRIYNGQIELLEEGKKRYCRAAHYEHVSELPGTCTPRTGYETSTLGSQ